MRRNAYTVKYKWHDADEVKKIYVVASSKEEAYNTAVYETLERIPYSAWVADVTYNNGKYKVFNTHEGKPY